MTNTLTGVLLAAAAGLNAYIPLLALALIDRFTTRIDLETPYDFISSTLGILVLLLLLTVELILDKIPRIDLLNDLVNTAVRPAAGGFLAMAVTNGDGDINIVVAMLFGLAIAAAVHAAKSLSRIRITKATNGIGNPLVSMVEDGVAGVVSLFALLLPWVGLAIAIIMGVFMTWFYRASASTTIFSPKNAKPANLRPSDSTPRIHSVNTPESVNAED